jgi:alpha-aminoadipate/glutamate carrier protein LysW
MNSCPECGSPVAAGERSRVAQILTCGGCGAELEVLSVEPLTLALAPQPEEDWGE